MRLLIVLTLSCGLSSWAADPQQAKDSSAEPKTAQGSQAGAEGMVKTPFGWVKKQEQPKPTSQTRPAPQAKPLVEAKVVGDKVNFSRKTPFGVQRWTRSRSELSAEEKKLLDQIGVKLEPSAAAAKSAGSAPPERH